MSFYLYNKSFNLTRDAGASVCVDEWVPEAVFISMGGDLSVSVRIGPAEAREFAEALIAAAAATGA